MIRQGLKQAMTASTKRSMPLQAALVSKPLARSKWSPLPLPQHFESQTIFLPYLLVLYNRFQNVASPG